MNGRPRKTKRQTFLLIIFKITSVFTRKKICRWKYWILVLLFVLIMCVLVAGYKLFIRWRNFTRDEFLNLDWSNVENPKKLSIDPKSFRDECFCNNFTESQNKDGEPVWVMINGIKIPPKARSQHMGYQFCGKTMEKHREITLRDFVFFQRLCSVLHIDVFTLVGGNLIPHVRDNSLLLPWDDDIDVGVKRSDFRKLIRFYETGEPFQVGKYEGWKLRKFDLPDDIVLVLGKDRSQYFPFGWFPFMKLRVYFNWEEIGDMKEKTTHFVGLDIWPPYKGISLIDSFLNDRYGYAWPDENEKPEDYHTYENCGIRYQTVQMSTARKWVNKVHGPECLEYKAHPVFQKD